MFSALMNAQNKIFSIPITSVTWSISVPTNSTYNGSAQSVTVVSVSPVGATYSTSTTSATNAGSVASTTITGTGIYTGSFTSPNLTIIRATPEINIFFQQGSFFYTLLVKIGPSTPLASGVGITYTDNTDVTSPPGYIANLTNDYQDPGALYSYFTSPPFYTYNTSQTTNWNSTNGSFSQP
jgi:hypothetical protein